MSLPSRDTRGGCREPGFRISENLCEWSRRRGPPSSSPSNSLLLLNLGHILDGQAELTCNPSVPLGLKLLDQLGAARPHYLTGHQNMDAARLDVIEEPLIVRDEEDAHVVPGELVHAGRHVLECVDVEAGVGLVHYCELGSE